MQSRGSQIAQRSTSCKSSLRGARRSRPPHLTGSQCWGLRAPPSSSLAHNRWWGGLMDNNRSRTQLVCCLPVLPTLGTGWRPFFSQSLLCGSIFCSCCLCDLTPSWPEGHCSAPSFTGQQIMMSCAVLVFNGFLNFWSHPSTYTAISAECLSSRSKMWARGHAQRSNPACWLFTLDVNFCVPHASSSWRLPSFTSRAIQ